MILLSSQIESIASRKDKTIKLTIATQELSPKDAADIFQLNQQFCYLAIKEEPFSKEEQDIVENLKDTKPKVTRHLIQDIRARQRRI